MSMELFNIKEDLIISRDEEKEPYIDIDIPVDFVT